MQRDVVCLATRELSKFATVVADFCFLEERSFVAFKKATLGPQGILLCILKVWSSEQPGVDLLSKRQWCQTWITMLLVLYDNPCHCMQTLFNSKPAPFRGECTLSSK